MGYLRPVLLSYYNEQELLEAGLDEAGRGCYAGPVFAAAVILPRSFSHPLLNDSKKMKKEDRDLLRGIIEKESLCYAVASVSNREIDKINILQASYKAMHLALKMLNTCPDFLLVDGNRFKPWKKKPHACIVKGDGQYASIAAASVLAKTYRDEYMANLHCSFAHYGWEQNKGYGTAFHRNAIASHGLCRYHRKSFNIFSAPLIEDMTPGNSTSD